MDTLGGSLASETPTCSGLMSSASEASARSADGTTCAATELLAKAALQSSTSLGSKFCQELVFVLALPQ